MLDFFFFLKRAFANFLPDLIFYLENINSGFYREKVYILHKKISNPVCITKEFILHKKISDLVFIEQKNIFYIRKYQIWFYTILNNRSR